MNNRNLEYDKALITTLRQNYGDTYLISDEYAHKKTRERVQVEPTCTDSTAHEPHEVFYVQFSDTGEGIRKWSRSPFEGARKCRVSLDRDRQVGESPACILETLRLSMREYLSHKIDADELILWFTEHLGMNEGGPFDPYAKLDARVRA